MTIGLTSCQPYEENNKPFVMSKQLTLYGCSSALAKFRNDRSKYSRYGYIAFAKGPALTETGMRGCGWAAFKKTQAEADSAAMAGCVKSAENPTRCVIIER
jgi:hypothetical protein